MLLQVSEIIEVKMQNPAYFGEFGGMFVPELLVPALKQLENEFNKAQKDPCLLYTSPSPRDS